MMDNKNAKTHSEQSDLTQPASKSQRKRDMQALQETGKVLTNLSPKKLAGISLSDTLLLAIESYRNITHREAKRRQLQYIGKLMRTADLEEIECQLRALNESSRQKVNTHHMAEHWRTMLLDKGKPALTDFINQFPQSNSQNLRQLIQQTHRDKAQHNNTGASKKLYRQLVQLIEFNEKTLTEKE